MNLGQELPYQPLREDLQLIKGDVDDDGFPTWKIYDPTRHQYFQIGWTEFEILSRWQIGDLDEILKVVNNDTTLSVNNDYMQKILTFLTNNNLTEDISANASAALLQKSKLTDKPWQSQLAHNYLFFKLKVLRPDKFLEKTLKYVKPLFSKKYLYGIGILAFISFMLIIRQFDQFVNTFLYFFNLQGMIYLFIAISFNKIVHEFGHAYAAKYYGCRVPNIGVAFLVMWPVLFTDTTDAWKLNERYKRFVINAAGMIAELSIAVIASFMWLFLPDGGLKSMAFFAATTSWVITLFINLNPFMRFDGYFLLADLWNVSNLQPRAFALAKWRLREFFFKFGEPPPHHFPKKQARLLVLYAIGTWLYRLVVFLGIAVLVYHIFFKLLGIILFIMEIWLLLAKPMYNELKQYWMRKQKIEFNTNTIATLCILGFLLLLFVLPWRNTIYAPSVLEYQQHTKIYTAHSGFVKNIKVKEDQLVKKDELLLKMQSPKLYFDLQQANADYTIAKLAMQRDAKKSRELGFNQANQIQINSKQNYYENFQEEINKLSIKAPFDGTVRSMHPGLKTGMWLGEDEYLLEIVRATKPLVQAYIPEHALNRVKIGGTAMFYPDKLGLDPFKVKIIAIDQVGVDKLITPYQASIYGGNIPVTKNKEGELAVNDSRYRMLLQPLKPLPKLYQIVRGETVIKGTRQSLLSRLWVRISAVLVKESGF